MKNLLWRAAKIVFGVIAILCVAIGGFLFWFDYQTGKCFEKRGDEAIAACTAYLQSDIDPDVLAHRGKAYLSKGLYDLAIADFNKSLEINPRNQRALEGRALSFDSTQRFDKAIADWSKIISMSPNDAYSYLGRAKSFVGMKKIDQARADWEKVLTLPDAKDGNYHEAARQNLSRFK